MLLFIFFLTIIISYIGTYLVEKLFLKFSLFIDKPEDRSIHKYPIPSAGGLSIIISFILYLLVLLAIYPANNISHIILLVSVMPVLIIGSIDDLKKIGVYKRLLVHTFSAIVIVYYFQIADNSFSVDFNSQSSYIIFFASVVLSMWLMNLYNFMDGIDGYAATESIFVALSASLIAYLNNPSSHIYMYLLGFGAANIGFLIRNWHPAKIFMGDTGSISTGCIFAFFIFYSGSESVISIYTWLILLSVFVSDATYTLFVRIVTKKNITKPHLTHAFHIITSSKKSQLFTVKALIFVNILWALPMAMLSTIYSNYHIMIAFVVYFPILLYLIKIGAGLDNRQKI
tara:strand:+ start:265 stop:1290 length:1026 start_codon:yes stop_codon:yes gene_type:complete